MLAEYWKQIAEKLKIKLEAAPSMGAAFHYSVGWGLTLPDCLLPKTLQRVKLLHRVLHISFVAIHA